MASPMTSLTSRTVNLSQQLQLQLLVFFVFLVSVAEPEPPVLERLWSRFFYFGRSRKTEPPVIRRLRDLGLPKPPQNVAAPQNWFLSCDRNPFGGTKFLMRPTPSVFWIRIRIGSVFRSFQDPNTDPYSQYLQIQVP